MTLEQSDEFTVRLGGPNLTNSEAINQQVEETVMVQAGEAENVYFWIVPAVLGRMNIQVKAQTPLAADALRRPLLVEVHINIG